MRVTDLLHIPAKLYGSSLHRNAAFMMGNFVATAAFGFFFWTAAARLFPDRVVGLASATFSAMNLVMMIAGLGMGIGLVKYMAPSTRRRELVATAFSVTGLAALAISSIFLLGVPLWAPALDFMVASPIWVAVFVASSVPWVWGPILDQTFIACRKAHLALARNAALGSGKLALLLLASGLGIAGILASWIIALLASVLLAMLLLPRVTGFAFPLPFPNIGEFRRMFSFASANYAAGFLHMLPTTIMPLMVAGILGEEMTAYYYVSWMIASALFIIPTSIGTSYLAEGSANPHRIEEDFRQALAFAYSLTLPGAAMVWLLANHLLGLFGEAYALNAAVLLRFAVLSIPAYTFNHVFIARKNVEKRLSWVVGGNVIVTLFMLPVAAWGLPRLGLVSVAYGFGAGHLAFFAVALFVTVKQERS